MKCVQYENRKNRFTYRLFTPLIIRWIKQANEKFSTVFTQKKVFLAFEFWKKKKNLNNFFYKSLFLQIRI